MKHSRQNLKRNSNFGLTLVELLVVVAILSVITAIMIPRLRTVNKDRNIREAARVVGSTMAKASTRAINDGVAGVLIERKNNFVDENAVYFAASRMFLMRKLPPFSGDDVGSLATVTGGGANTMNVEIDVPLEHTATSPIIQAGDEIRLNHSSVRYRITNSPTASGGTLNLTCSLGLSNLGSRPTLADGDYPFVIYRLPKKLESSQVDLPDGYYIDLRLSGPMVATPATPPTAPDWERGSVFDDATFAGDTVEIYFDSHGAIRSFRFNTSFGPQEVLPIEAFNFYVTGIEPEAVNTTSAVLRRNSSMWVTVDNSTGSTNVAYNAPPPAALTTVYGQAQYARRIGRTRQSANQ